MLCMLFLYNTTNSLSVQFSLLFTQEIPTTLHIAAIAYIQVFQYIDVVLVATTCCMVCNTQFAFFW